MNRNSSRLFLLLVGLLVFPFFLDRRWRVVRRVIIRGKPADIFPLVNDLRNWPRWTAWNRREDVHYSHEGTPSGTGAVQKWSSRRMEGELRITQSVPGERVAYALDLSGGKYHLEGVFVLEPAGPDFTRVTWMARWHSDANPYGRYLDLLMRWWIGRDFEAGLQNLRALAEVPAPALSAV